MLCIQSVFISIITLTINTEKNILYYYIFCDVIKQSDKVKKKVSRAHRNREKEKKNLHAQEIVWWVKGQKK